MKLLLIGVLFLVLRISILFTLSFTDRDVILQIVERLQLNYSPFNDQIIGFFTTTCKKMEECCNYLLDETVKSKQEDYYLFLKDILYNISFFIQCLPTVPYIPLSLL